MKMSIWIKLLVIVMGILLSGSLGFNISEGNSDVKFSATMKKEFKSIVVEAMQDELKTIKADISGLKASNIEEITGRAITAYSKVYTLDDLKDSPEKRFSITQGLKLDSCYATLLKIDHDRTVMFYEYLVKNTI